MLVQDFSGFLELSWALVASLGLVFGALLGSLGLSLGVSWGSLGASLRSDFGASCVPERPGALLGSLKVGFIEVKRWVMKRRN